MKIFYTLSFLFLFSFFTNAQTVNVSGKCMSGTITLSKIGDLSGKAAYQGTGTVLGYNGITVSVYYIGSPDNVWVIDFEGQPYFMNKCNTDLPPATENQSCNWIAVTGTEDCTGSALFVGGSGTLSVSLFEFNARKEDTRVLLSWKTASENNNKGFEIQRSQDAINWNKIGFVNGAINSSLENNYSFNDVNPLQGKNFYRLRQFDLDGNPTLSAVVNVDFYKNGNYTLANNPGNGNYLLNINSAEGAMILVSDMTGRRLISKHINAGINQLDISKYANGVYLLHLQIGAEVFTEKLLKE